MGRWVRWFGAEEPSGAPGGEGVAVAIDVAAPMDQAARELASPGVRVVETRSKRPRYAPPAPTGIISIERLPGEMLTAVLVRQGALSADDELFALQEHRSTGRPVEEILIDNGTIEESELVSVLARTCRVPHLSLEDYQIEPDVIEIIPPEFARANRVVPLERLGKLLNVATSNPLDIATIGRLREQTGLNVKAALASPREIRECLDRFYPPPPGDIPPEPVDEDVTVSTGQILREMIGGGRAGAEAAGSEASAGETSPDGRPAGADAGQPLREKRAVLLSEDAVAFTQHPSGALCRAWEEEVGVGFEGELAAIPAFEAEFALVAADEPFGREPPAAEPSEEAETKTRAERSTRSSRSEKSVKTKSKKKGKKRKRKRSGKRA